MELFMNWLLLAINLLTLIVSMKKRVLPYSIITAMFIFLVIGQAFQVQADLSKVSVLYYPYSAISERGFDLALWYVLGASIILLILACISKGYRTGCQPIMQYTFKPPVSFYLLLIAALILISGVLIFGVIGLNTFLTASRPGNQAGATLFIMLLSVGVFPILLKLICKSKVCKYDIICFAIAVGASGGFSRMHVILYLVTLLLVFYYSTTLAEKKVKIKGVLALICLGTLMLVFFMAIGALRDAENYVNGNVADLLAYNLDHPETSLFSFQYTYKTGIEGMAGLSGAISEELWHPDQVSHYYFFGLGLEGVYQILPALIKNHVEWIITDIQSLYWYQKPEGNVSPGIEISFVCFGWPGFVIYAIAFYLYAWLVPIIALKNRISPQLRLIGFLWLGCGIFFVRGSWSEWIGFSLAYLIIALLSWPFISFWIVKRKICIAKSHDMVVTVGGIK
jgi:hypothetical protein